MRIAAAALLAAAVLGVTAGAGVSGDRHVNAGDKVFVRVPLVCAVEKGKNALAVVCLARNPKTGHVFKSSLGVAIVAGKKSQVAIQYYSAKGRVTNIWLRRQPGHPSTGVFRSDKGGKVLLGVAGDRFLVGGTNLLCPVSGSQAILCAVVDTKTLQPVPGTYGIYADAKSVEVARVTKNGDFKTVRAYKQPPLIS